MGSLGFVELGFLTLLNNTLRVEPGWISLVYVTIAVWPLIVQEYSVLSATEAEQRGVKI